MSTTPARPGAPANRLPARTRDRRPALAALALLLVLLGALGSALIVFRSSERQEVLVANATIQQGQVVTAEDFRVAEVAFDEGTQVVGSGSLPNFVGTYAVSQVPEGSLVSAQMFSPEPLAPQGTEQVGVVVPSVGRPADGFRINDIVDVYTTVPQTSQGESPDAEPLVQGAKIIGLGPLSETRDTLHVTLLLPEDAAPAVISASAGGTAALTVLPADIAPVVDWRTQ